MLVVSFILIFCTKPLNSFPVILIKPAILGLSGRLSTVGAPLAQSHSPQFLEKFSSAGVRRESSNYSEQSIVELTAKSICDSVPGGWRCVLAVTSI